MKGLTWKKIMSLVLAVALVIGAMQFNAKTVSADEGEKKIPVTVTPDTTNLKNPAVSYTLAGETTTVEGTKTDVVLAIDLSNSMVEAEKGHWEYDYWDWEWIWVVDTPAVDNLTPAKNAAKAFVEQLYAGPAKDYVSVSVVGYGTLAKKFCELTPIKTDEGKAAVLAAIDQLAINAVGGTRQYSAGGTNIDAALEMTETILKNGNTTDVLVLLSDGVPTIYNTKNGLAGPGNQMSDEVKNATLNEATAAKNQGVEIYTIVYGATDDAVAVMAQISSGEGYKFTSDYSESVITSVYTTVGENIGEKQYTGTGASIVATLSPYVAYAGFEAVEGAPGTVTINDAKTVVTWGTFNIDKPGIPSHKIKFNVTATADELVAAANDANNKLVNWKDDTKTVIQLYATSQTVLKYNVNKEQIVDDVWTIDFTIGKDIVPYTVNYTLDGQANGTPVTGYAYVGDEIPVNTNYLNNDAKYTISYPTDKTAKADSENELTVAATTNKATVNFYDIDVEATEANEENKAVVEKLVKTITVDYGNAITDTEAVAELRKSYEKRVTSGSAITFTWNENEPWKNAQGEVVALGTASQASYAFFANYGDTATSYKHVIFKDDDGTIFVDGWFKTGDTVSDYPMQPQKTYDEAQYSKYEFIGWYDEDNKKGDFSDVYTVVDDVVYTATYDKVIKKYDVKYVYGDTTFETVNVEYGTKVVDAVADIKDSAETKAIAAAQALTDAADNNKDVYSFTGWDKTFTDEVVKADVVITAIISATALKDYTVKYYYQIGNDVVYLEGKDQKVKAGVKLAMISTDETKRVNDENYIYNKTWYEKSGAKVFGGMDIFQNLDIVFEYRAAQKATFTFFKYEVEVGSDVPECVISFDETTLALIKAPNGPAKDKKVEGNTTTEYTFDKWVTWMTNADILDRTPVVENPEADIVDSREMTLSAEIAPMASTEEADGKWISYAEYMEKYFRIEDKEFFPTYTETTTTSNPDPDPDPVVTQFIILPPVVTETPEEPTATPTEVPATPTPTEAPIEIEETETPEGDVDLEETETPQAAPEEEELDVEPIDTPQGDLPQTGVAPSAVFFGIGAACVVFGGAIVLKLRRKEEM